MEDHCIAIDAVLSKGKVGETYVIGAYGDIPNIEVIKKILGLLKMGEDMIEYVKDRPAHDRKYAMDPSKIKKELGWQAKYDLSTGLAQTVDWYKDHKNWWQKLKDREFEKYYERQYIKR